MVLKSRCGWSGCRVLVPAHLWGCRDHWFRLPTAIRADILAHYRAGQETRGGAAASAKYMEALMAAARWIRDYGGDA